MADPDRVQTIVDAAERAAGAKDFVAAERLLREAIQLQEADLGPDHPDLANTLNNLGVLCEMAGQPSEAEACYRRAYDISATALPSDHPFVITSRENLTEFSKARGTPLDLPLPGRPAPLGEPLRQPSTEPSQVVETPPVAETPRVVETPRVDDTSATVDTPAVVPAPPAVTSPRAETRAPASAAISSRLALVIVGVVVLILVFVVSRRSVDRGGSAPDAATVTNAATGPEERPAAPAPSVSPATPPPAASPADPAPSSPQARPAGRPGADQPERDVPANRGALPQPLVATALLCQRFSARGSPDWQCDPARGSVGRGTLVFYTRIRSARPATVQHRWYRGDELHQSVRLDVQANQVAGYRTYSRYTVPVSGAWRVELRTMDGALLHEERFEVR